MATLVGVDAIGAYSSNTAANSVSATRFIHDSFVASASGTAKRLWFYATDSTGDAPNTKLAIYSSAGALLGQTSAIQFYDLATVGPAWLYADLTSDVTITSGVTYKLGFIGANGYVGYRTLASPAGVSYDASGTYTTLPSTISSTADAGIYQFAMFAEGAPARIVGTPVEITSASGSYTPAAGSNRVVVMLAAQKSGTGQTLTNIVWNGVTRTPTVTIADSAYGDRDGVGVCIFKESELPAGASTATATWSGTPGDISIFCFTVENVDQTTTVRTSGSVAGLTDGSGYTASIDQTVTAGDLQLGVFAGRQNAYLYLVPQNLWVEDFDVVSTGGNGACFGVGHKTVNKAASPCRWRHTDGGASMDYALATVALIPAGISTGSWVLSKGT